MELILTISDSNGNSLETENFDLQDYTYKLETRGDSKQAFILRRTLLENDINLRTLEFYSAIANLLSSESELNCEVKIEHTILMAFNLKRISYYIEGSGGGSTQFENLEIDC